MDAAFRREQVLEAIASSEAPLSASTLAADLKVSRQIIVGDVALLRAQGQDIIATARGYTIPSFAETGQYLGRLACHHDSNDLAKELYTMVDLGATVVNVIVEHELYGEITGQLNLKSRDDVDQFVARYRSSNMRLLSELSQGIHLHTVACQDKTHFDQVHQGLQAKGYLYPLE
ncbi:MAG: transcription repressor NadR [Coriobacteriia bacterium]|nr:transcription repressor NadR [Coriobacteriia bacterium]MCL2870358.1 transcription repressor NadR [Coriobacteriia bacterium]